jgi:hypothetical protein
MDIKSDVAAVREFLENLCKEMAELIFQPHCQAGT